MEGVDCIGRLELPNYLIYIIKHTISILLLYIVIFFSLTRRRRPYGLLSSFPFSTIFFRSHSFFLSSVARSN